MKKLLLFILLFIPFISYTQTSVIGRMEAEILTPVSVIETELLNFGKIIIEVGGGTVVISPMDERLATGNIILVDDNYTAGKFLLSGVPESLASIQLPSVPQKIYSTKGSSEITIDKFTSNIPVGGQIMRQRDGKAEIAVGATLYINGMNNQMGFYSGSYEVVFTYN
jgi:hypothetical protein